MKNFLIIIGILAATAGILWFQMSRTADGSPVATADAVTAQTPSLLAAAEQSFDFGRVSMQNGKVAHKFLIKNPTDKPITVSKLFTSCMCTQAALIRGDKITGPFGMPGHNPIPAIDEKLAPGEEAVIEAVFDPAAHGPAGIGAIARTVYIENDSSGPLALDFKAYVTP